MSTATTLTFGDLTAEMRPAAGGKGGTLARLFRAGYPVPDGFVVFPGAFSGDELTSSAWTRVQAQLARMRDENGSTAFAVRSSALKRYATMNSADTRITLQATPRPVLLITDLLLERPRCGTSFSRRCHHFADGMPSRNIGRGYASGLGSFSSSAGSTRP